MTRPWTDHDIPPLTGRVAVVTGANSGLGFHTVRGLAAHGAEVVMACRDPAKAQAALATLRAELPHAKLVVMPLDLADLASVRRFTEALAPRYSQLDLLCNNAGVMALPERKTHDGFEMQIGTNHLGHFALTGLLLPLLARSPTARIVTVSSLMHLIGRIRFDDIHRRQHYAKWSAYAQSKLANLMFALELARRLPAQTTTRHIISAAAHPGYAATELQMAGPKMANSSTDKLAMAISNALLAQPAHMGALPSLYAATAPDVVNGEFFGPNGWFGIRGTPTRSRPSARARDEQVAARLWELSERLTGVAYLSG